MSEETKMDEMNAEGAAQEAEAVAESTEPATGPAVKNEVKKTAKFSVGRIIGTVIILFILLCLIAPKALFFLTQQQQEAITLFRDTYFGQYVPFRTEDGHFDFLRIVAVIFLCFVCGIVCWLLRTVFNAIQLKNRHADTIKGLIANVLRYAVVIFCIIYGLNMLGADILTVIASLGILALIIGFGAQSLIEDIFAGLFIIFEGRFYVGDIISVEGFRGTVRSIGIVSTSLADAGGNIKIINNSDIRTLTNLSEVVSVAVSIVSIAYGADLRKAEKVVEDLCQQLPDMYPDLFEEVPSYLGVEELNDSSVDLKVIAKVDESNIYKARRIMNRELKLALDENGIEIPFPQIVVHRAK